MNNPDSENTRAKGPSLIIKLLLFRILTHTESREDQGEIQKPVYQVNQPAKIQAQGGHVLGVQHGNSYMVNVKNIGSI